MSKTSNLQRLHVFKVWLESLKAKKPKPTMKKTYTADEEE